MYLNLSLCLLLVDIETKLRLKLRVSSHCSGQRRRCICRSRAGGQEGTSQISETAEFPQLLHLFDNVV